MNYAKIRNEFTCKQLLSKFDKRAVGVSTAKMKKRLISTRKMASVYFSPFLAFVYFLSGPLYQQDAKKTEWGRIIYIKKPSANASIFLYIYLKLKIIRRFVEYSVFPIFIIKLKQFAFYLY